jgi:hypothetical protein
MLLGPVLSVPVGFTIFTVIAIIIMMILSEITWVKSEHLPEDDLDWSDGNHFVIDEDKDKD